MSKHKFSGLAGILCGFALFFSVAHDGHAAGAPLTFTNAPSAGPIPLTVSFTAPTTDANGALTNFNWDFGDGTTSTNQNPAHIYTNAGVYSALLTGNDIIGQSYYAVGSTIYASLDSYQPLYQVTTPAGQSTNPGTNDGPRNGASLSSPWGIVTDTNGNIYWSESGSDMIRKMTPTGQVSRIAGQPNQLGSSVGPGLTSALFSGPTGLAIDRFGNMFVAGTVNDVIEELRPNGVNWDAINIAGVAGTPGYLDGTATNALFSAPGGIGVDALSNVYVSDQGNFCIRKISPSGTNWTVSTLAGNHSFSGTNDGTNSSAEFMSPGGMAIDPSGNIYVTDTQADTIRMVTPLGVVTTIAGYPLISGSVDGFGTNASFNSPGDIAIDGSGNLFVADTGNKIIRKMTLVGTNWDVTTVVGTANNPGTADGSGAAASFSSPEGIAVDNNGNLLATDSGADTLRKCFLGSGFTFNVSSGSKQTFFIDSGRNAWAMGDNSFGQLGTGNTTSALQPEIVRSGVAAAIQAGDFSSYLIDIGLGLFGTGSNDVGQLGTGDTNQLLSFLGLTGPAIAVAGGVENFFWLRSDGSLWGAGLNDYGQLGVGNLNDQLNHVSIVSSNVTAVAASRYHTAFTKTDGSLWVMGGNMYGQLGDASLSSKVIPEMIVPSNVVSVAAGVENTFFIETDGSLWAMGDNTHGQLGDNVAESQSLTPKEIISSGVVAVAAGSYHTLFVKSDGSLWVMGDNTYGELGMGTNTTSQTVPFKLASTNVVSVSTGQLTSFFVKGDGSLWGMGLNSDGELGDGTLLNHYTPEEIAPWLNATATPTSGSTPLTVQFTAPATDTNGNSITSWFWSFGDGTTSTNQNPSHLYTTNGAAIFTNYVAYSPTLLMTNYGGFPIVGMVPAIIVDLPTVQFAATPTSGQTPLGVSFTSPNHDSGGVLITNWRWNFGDGSGIYTNENLPHTFTNAGAYSPTLTVINTNGSVIIATGPAIVAQTPSPVVSESPGAIGSDYAGSVDLRITNLQGGSTILVQKYIDLNSDAVVGPEDLLISQYQVTDGVGAPVIGGVTNINIPADWNPTNGDITLVLDRVLGGAEHSLTANYLYVISSPSNVFAPVTNTFSVTNAAYSQSFTGTVNNNGAGVPNAIVWLLAPAQPGNGSVTFIGGAVADSSGNYVIAAPPGSYQLVPFASGMVANLADSPVLALASNAPVTANLILSNATTTISGSLVDAANSAITLPGVMMAVFGQDGAIGFGASDSNGDYSLPVLSGSYGVDVEPIALAIHGYVDLNSGYNADTTGGSVTGLEIPFPQATSLLYGSVTDAGSNALPGVRIKGVNGINGSGVYQSSAATDGSGNYVVGVVAGNWSGEVDPKNPNYDNYIFSTGPSWAYENGGVGTNISPGTAIQENFQALIATNQINGTVTDDSLQPLAGIAVTATATINGVNYLTSADTDSSGNYGVNVASGGWILSVNCGCGDPDCLATNYFCPGSASITVANMDVTGISFVAPLASSQISGYISDENENALVNVLVTGEGSVEGGNYELTAYTDGTGYYSFDVPQGSWVISVACTGANSLSSAGYQCVSAIPLEVSSGNYFANFTPQPLGAPPAFVYTANPTNGAAPLTVQFGGPSVDANDNSIVGWFWGFGDGGQTNGENPSYTFDTPGIYNPYLNVTNNLGQTSTVPGPTIEVTGGTVAPSVQAWSVSSQLSPGGGGFLAIDNLFGTPPFSYQWALNGTNIAGATSTEYSITNATVADAGNYTVAISNGFGSINFGPMSLAFGGTAQFTASPAAGTVPLAVGFAGPSVDSSGIPITNWQWTFGDGNAINGQYATNIYSVASNYSPNLIVMNNTGATIDATGPSINAEANLSLTNLVQNGGFETGDFTGWNMSGDTNGAGVVSFNSGFGPAHSGNHFAVFYTAADFGYLSQTLPTIPGSNYVITFSVNLPPPDPDDLQVSWDGNVVFSQTNIINNDWISWQKTVTATSSNTVLTIAYLDSDSYLALDDISVTLAPAATGCVNPPASLAYWWSAEENALDNIGGNNGALQNSAAFTNGEVGHAFEFNGSDAYVSTSTLLNDPENFGLGLWFKTTTTNGGALIGFGDSQIGESEVFDRTIFMDTNGALHFGIFYVNQIFTVDSLGGYNDGQWHYVAANSSAAGIELYVDGGLASSDSYPTNAESISGYWRIGENGFATCCWPYVPTSYYFQGAIDEVSIFNSTLDSNQVASIYEAGSAGMCGGPAPIVPVCAPAPSGLVSWWPGEGNAFDIASGDNGALSNVTFVPGEVGQAFNFTNINSGVLLGNPTNLQLQNFTIEAWIRRASASIVSQDPNAFEGNALFFGYGASGYGFGLFPGGALDLTAINVDNIQSSASVADTNWHHVAVTKSGSSVVFYLDGQAYPYGSAYNDTFQFITPAAIGARGDTAAAGFSGQVNTFYGSIDELSIYNRALASNEIASIYLAGSEGKCASGLSANVITFDDINDNGNGTLITNGYHGLNWSNFYCFNAPDYTEVYPTNGYLMGMVSSPDVAYNYGGTPAFISSGAPFVLNSGDFTAAWNNGMTLETVGFNGSAVAYSNNFLINATGPTAIPFPNVAITSMEFVATGGTNAGYDGNGTQFVLDNLVIGNGTAPTLPVITWPAPAPIVYGTPLSANQLDATASAAGNFVYSPVSGTVLNAGANTLTAIFTPADTTTYSSVSTNVTLTVSRAPLTGTISNAIWLLGGATPTFSGTLTGTNFADGLSLSFTNKATASSAPGTYPIFPVIHDPNNRLGNYVVTTNIGILTLTKGVALTSPANGAIFTAPASISVAAIGTLPGGVQSIAVYMNSTLLATTNGASISTTATSIPAGDYQFSAVAMGSNNQTFTQTAYVTVNTIGTSRIDFDPLDTSLGVMTGLPLSSYLAGFGITISNVTFGTTLEAATGPETASQNRSVTNDLPIPLSTPNLFTQVGSTKPVSFTLTFPPQNSFGFTRVAISNTGGTTISHPAWSAHILDASGNELESVSEPLLSRTNSLRARTFTLIGSNITSVRFNSDSQAGASAFAAVLLDDLVLSANPTNDPMSITMSQPANGTAPATIPLSATAADTRTNIDHVSFYSGPTLIGTVSNSPYNFTWSNVLNGTYILTAQAVDKAGYAKASAPVTNTINPGGNSTVVNFDALNALPGPVTDGALSNYLAQFDGTELGTNTIGSSVAVENQAKVAGGGFVTPSSLPNLLTQIGANGPVTFTVNFSNQLSQFSFTRPQLLANPYVTHPAWQVQAFDAVGQPLGSVSALKISSATNVPPQPYTLTNPPGGGGIASVQFSSEGTGLQTFNAMLLDDFVLTLGSNLPPSAIIASPTNGQVFASLLDIPISVDAVPGSGAITGVSYFFNGTLITNASSNAPISWNAPSNGLFFLTAIVSNSLGLSTTSTPVAINISVSGFAIVSAPTNLLVGVGGNANFSVTTSGATVSYQWQSNGAAIAGATLPVFSVNNVQAGAAGSYTVVVSSGGESITSQPPAVLTVLSPPSINSVSPGTNVTVTLGTNITLSVTATEADPIAFFYQWQRNGEFIDGATNSAYVISNAQPSDSGQYEVLVANALASQESPVFTVAVNFAGGNEPSTTNDVFASSLTIDPTNGPTAGDSSDSADGGEVPVIAGKPASKFLWYNWTADFTGVITLSTLGSSFDTLMGIYTGNNPGGFTTIAEDDDSAGYFASECTFNCVQGTTYQIAVAGYKGASGDVVLSCPGFVLIDTNYQDAAEPVIVQNPTNQIVAAGDTVTLAVTATNASIYQWFFNDAPIAGATGTELVITNFPTSASGNYYVEAANDIGSVQSDIAGIQLQNPSQTQDSSGTLVVDKFGDAVDLSGVGSQDRYRHQDDEDTGGFVLSQSFSTEGATKEQGEPNHAGQPGGASYWYSYTSSGNGPLQFDTKGSSFNTILAVYTGPGDKFSTLINAGAAFTTNYLTAGQPVVIVTNGSAGTKYFIAIDGYQGASGAAHLDIVEKSFTNIPAGPGVLVVTNNSVVLAMSAPGNNIYTTSSNLTVRGMVRGIAGAQSPFLSFVQLGINGGGFGHTALTATNFAAVRVAEPGGAVGIVPQETILWTTNITLVPGVNAITAQSISVQGTNIEIASHPVTHTVFLVTSLPTPADKSIITLLVSPVGHGRITGVRNQANLELNKVYRVKAESVGNYIFTNWTSGTSTNALAPLFGEPSLSFIMTSNLILQANFVTNPFTAVAGIYNGLFAATNDLEDSSGFFTATVPPASRGAFSAKLLMDDGAHPFSGSFDLSGDAQKTINRFGKPPVTVQMHLNLATPDDTLTGNVAMASGTSGWNSTLLARAAYNIKEHPLTNYAGKYTMVLGPGSGSPSNAPSGFSSATLSANAAGRFNIAGRTADNAPMSQSVSISKDGSIPLYFSLYSRKGSLMGWLSVTNQNILGSNLTWIKLPSRGTVFAAGFTNGDLNAFGSIYTNGLVLTNATLTIGAGSPPSGLVVSNISLSGNKLTSADDSVKGTLAPGAGVLTLTVKPGGVEPVITAKGVMLENQGQTNAAGWFFGTDQSGYFLLQQ